MQKGHELMAEELFIPKLGQTVEQVTLINWLIKDGDKVEQGQDVLEVETDKAVFSVEAVDSGYIHLGPFKAGDVLPVLTVVALIGKQDEKYQVKESTHSADVVPEDHPEKITPKQKPDQIEKRTADKLSSSLKQFVSPRARRMAREKNVNLNLVTPTGGNGIRVREEDVVAFLSQAPKVSPLAKVMAELSGLDLRSVTASGPRGEVTRADVEMALARRAIEKQLETATAKAPTPVLPELEVAERIPLKGVRGVIAERMGLSSRATARVTLLMEVDATALVELREKMKADFEEEWGFAPGYNDLLARTCALALRQFPYINARLNGEVIERLARINIGIAVDAEKGLYVPVIQDADKKDLRAIGSEFRQRVEEVRSGKIMPEHLTGGTFTITNLGMYEVDGFTPVINLPEAAILGVGQIAPRPVVRENKVVIRQMMTLSLAFDHRLVDGAPAARFLQHLKQQIESPEEDLLNG